MAKQTELQRLAEEMASTYSSDDLQALKELSLYSAMQAHEESMLDIERRFLAKAEIYNAALHWQGVYDT